MGRFLTYFNGLLDSDLWNGILFLTWRNYYYLRSYTLNSLFDVHMVNSLSVEYFDFNFKAMIHFISSNLTYKLTSIHTQGDKVKGRDNILHEAVTCPPSSAPPLCLSHLSYLALCRVSFPCNVTEFGYCFLQRCSTVISVAAKHTHTCMHTNALVHATLSKSFGSGFCVINWRFKFAQIPHNSILQLFQFDIFCFY